MLFATFKGGSMEIREIVSKNRSYRRFYNEKKITKEELVELVDIARLTPSAANRQPVKYMVVADEERNAKVYETLGWAGYLKDWDGPEKEERPTGYILILTKKDVKADVDEGIISQTIMMAAVEKGMGGCILGNIKREKLMENLNIDEEYKVDLVLAIGYPKEEVKIVDIKDNDIKYYNDENKIHYVPKRKLEEVLM